MSDCCSSSSCSTPHKKKHRCPENGVEYQAVSSKTIAHHIAQPWEWDDRGHAYYFCEDPDCDVAYYSDDDQIILTSELRTKIGTKSSSDDGLICYCFGVSKADVRKNPSIKDYVVEQTKQKICSCDTSNPSGRCCLKDFPRDKSK